MTPEVGTHVRVVLSSCHVDEVSQKKHYHAAQQGQLANKFGLLEKDSLFCLDVDCADDVGS